MAPIGLFLEKNIANYIRKNHDTPASKFIRRECENIRLRHPATRRQILQQKATPMVKNLGWLREKAPDRSERGVFRSVTNEQGVPQQESWKRAWKRITREQWDARWTKYIDLTPLRRRSPALLATKHDPEKLHADASKATTSLITQIRTEKIGLNAFLFDRKVPDRLPSCGCGWPRQTAKHIIRYCPDWEEMRGTLRSLDNWRDYQRLIGTATDARTVARWLQRTGLLPQFSLGLEH